MGSCHCHSRREYCEQLKFDKALAMIRQAVMLLLVVAMVTAKPLPQTSTIDTSHGVSQNIIDSVILHIADEKVGSKNTSNNTSTNSSSNKSTNRSVNFDDFLENGKKGPTSKQLVGLVKFLQSRSIPFQVKTARK